MSRIKINLASGNVVDKPLITCFKGTNGDYLVLDNETNGSMGLPIICISKINGTNLDKIVDPNEWAAVKENLKTIIAGTALPYLSVAETLSAPDDFFTQLTLPVASFDLLKSVYQPVPAAPVAENPIAAPVVPNMAPAVAPMPMVDAPVVANPQVPHSASVAPMEMAPAPLPVVEPVAPVMSAAPMVNDVTLPVTPAAEPVVPMVDPVPEIAPAMPMAPDVQMPVNVDDDIAVIKENFMKSCETMFDALIKKFENK